MGFPIAVLVINLDRSTDRLAFMRDQAARIGFEFERIPGVEGLNVPPDLAPYFAHIKKNKPPIIDDGAVGCYASHLKAYARIRDSGMPAALVMEDDVRVPNDIAAKLQELLSKLPAQWDFVHLAHARIRAVKPLLTLSDGARIVRYSRIPAKGAGYLMSRAGAEKFLNPGILRSWAIDLDTRRPWVFGHDAYGVDPPPLEQLPMPTTIPRAGERRSMRRGLPRPTRLTWTNSPLHTPAALIFNVRQLGPVWWLRCFAVNCFNMLRGKIWKRQRDTASDEARTLPS